MAVNDDSSGKVKQIFSELAGQRAANLAGDRLAQESIERIRDALAGEFDLLAADDIAFHLADWNSDAAFIVALHLFPERFTREEIEDGVRLFLSHAPNHVAAAAKLYGMPIKDIFEVGALEGDG